MSGGKDSREPKTAEQDKTARNVNSMNLRELSVERKGMEKRRRRAKTRSLELA